MGNRPLSERVARWLSSLSAKYIAVFALLVAVPVICTSVYLLDSSYQDNKRELTRLQQEKAKSVSVTIGQYFKDLIARMSSVHGQYLSFTALGSTLAPLLETDATAAFYIDHDGRETLATAGGGLSPLPGNFSHRPDVEQARATRVYYGPAYAPRPLSNPGARAMEVVVREGLARGGSYWAHGGFVGETLDLGPIQDLVLRTRLGTSGYVYAVDAQGAPIAYPNASALTHRSLRLPQVTKALASSSTGSTVGRNFRGQRVLSTWATVEPVGWKVFVEQPESAVFAPVRGKIWRTALLLAAFLAAGIGLSVLLARRLVRPVKQMRTSAARIGAGAYDERIELRRRDELGGLADELNGMAASLQASVQSLEQRVEERTRELQQALAGAFAEGPPARGRERAQERVPGEHVARAADAAERDDRLLAGVAEADVRRDQREAGGVPRRHPCVRQPPALADQRRARPVQGRGRPGRARGRHLLAARGARARRRDGARAGRGEGRPTLARARARRRPGRRRREAPASGGLQPPLERRQVHAGGREHRRLRRPG